MLGITRYCFIKCLMNAGLSSHHTMTLENKVSEVNEKEDLTACCKAEKTSFLGHVTSLISALNLEILF